MATLAGGERQTETARWAGGYEKSSGAGEDGDSRTGMSSMAVWGDGGVDEGTGPTFEHGGSMASGHERRGGRMEAKDAVVSTEIRIRWLGQGNVTNTVDSTVTPI